VFEQGELLVLDIKGNKKIHTADDEWLALRNRRYSSVASERRMCCYFNKLSATIKGNSRVFISAFPIVANLTKLRSREDALGQK
jgi:hypothetical protein